MSWKWHSTEQNSVSEAMSPQKQTSTHVVLHVLVEQIDERLEVATVVRHDQTHVVVNTDFAAR